MEFRFLSKEFFIDYPYEKYPELMTKEDRPYTQVITDINGMKFAVPLRSGISHSQNVLWTNKKLGRGLDFTKAVLILDDKYIDDRKVFIRVEEYKHLYGKEKRVKEKMERCIEDYKRAKSNLQHRHNREYCSYSSLQYFEKYIYTDDII